jgi:hypothetical protein
MFPRHGCQIFLSTTNQKGPPKYTQIGIFGMKIKPSGNPGSRLVSSLIEETCDSVQVFIATEGNGKT